MTGQLMLVIVVVAAGIVIAAAIFWRAALASHRGSARSDGEQDDGARSLARPASADGPSSGDIADYDASPGDSFAPTLAPKVVARDAASHPPTDPRSATSATVASSTPGPPAGSIAPTATQPEPAPARPAFGDASELEFTIDVREQQRRTNDPASTAPPAPSVSSAPTASPAPDAESGAISAAPTTAVRAGSTTGVASPERPALTAASSAPSPAPAAPRRSPGGVPEADAEFLQPPEVFAKLFDLALGKARPASMVTSGHQDVAAATAAALEDVATQQRYAPRRPNMLPRILSASSDDSFSQRQLAALIAQDPSLVGNLLKIANSSYYRVTQEPVESVDRAVVLLGTDGIRSLVTAALMQPIFRIGGADFPRFPEIAWEHTFRSASAAVPYNFLVEKSDPFAAELLSLVMGLGEIVVFRVTMDQYAKNPRLRPDAGVVSGLLDAHSATVARRIGASWELSESTLAGLDGQAVNTTTYSTALGRSLYFGRVVGALAVLRINRVVDDAMGKASVPRTSMPGVQVDRMWTKLTLKLEKH